MSDEQASPVELVIVTIDGLSKLVQWVAAGATFDERQHRGELAKRALERCLNAAPHDELNTEIRKDISSGQADLAWPHNAFSRN